MAIENYEKALKFNPKDDLMYNNLGNAYFSMGLYSKAVERYKAGIDIEPDIYPVQYSNVGDACRRLKRWDEAIEYYEQAVKKEDEMNHESHIEVL